MNKRHFYIANWKMYWSFDETINFATKHYDNFVQLSQDPLATIVLCPSAPALYPLAQMFDTTAIAVGAQDCSEHHKGAFTGQTSANHLKAAGCAYCIIGHSERRRLNAETSNIVAEKCNQLLQASIIPIICIGETDEENKGGLTLQVLEEQLQPVLNLLQLRSSFLGDLPILIAYEPVWAIGTGLTPTIDHIQTTFAWLATKTTQPFPLIHWGLIYGGSIDQGNIDQFKTNTIIDGFLIGGASLDFQEFEKIVKYTIKG